MRSRSTVQATISRLATSPRTGRSSREARSRSRSGSPESAQARPSPRAQARSGWRNSSRRGFEMETEVFELAERLRQLPPYLFARIDKIKQEEMKKGKKLVALGIGDPDL